MLCDVAQFTIDNLILLFKFCKTFHCFCKCFVEFSLCAFNFSVHSFRLKLTKTHSRLPSDHPVTAVQQVNKVTSRKQNYVLDALEPKQNWYVQSQIFAKKKVGCFKNYFGKLLGNSYITFLWFDEQRWIKYYLDTINLTQARKLVQ